jgi:type IV secretion system protein VirB10
MSGSPPPPVASPVGGGGGPSWRKRALLWGAGLAAVGGVVWLTMPSRKHEDAAGKPASFEVPGQIGAPFDPSRTPREAAASLPVPRTTPTSAAADAIVQRSYKPAPLMAFGGPAEIDRGPGRPAGGSPGGAAGGSADAPGTDALSARLRAEDQPTAVATQLPDRNLFLTEGTPIPCVPDSPITSDVEGAFRCKVPEAVYSTSGAVPLLDAGTWIVGRVGAGLRRGQRRLFAVMTRVETPQGCLIRIRAPAADALGQAGLDGEIDSHFFERFGAYIGMAFLETGMQAAVLAASNAAGHNSGLQFYQFQNAGQQGGQSLFAEDAAIPPTLFRPQAQPIVVRLTQDIDMRTCFRLQPREAAR